MRVHRCSWGTGGPFPPAPSPESRAQVVGEHTSWAVVNGIHAYLSFTNHHMKYTLFLATALLTGSGLHAQVGLINGDFENYIQCPTGHGQVDLAEGWFTAIITPDFYNCSFLELTPFPTSTQAYSGQGWVGFLCSAVSPTKAEALAQHLNAPLLPGRDYRLQLAAKIPESGDYTNNCGGVAVYGFKSGLDPSSSYTHASNLPGAMLLGESGAVLNANWQLKEIALTIPDTVAHLLLTIGSIPSCEQYIFIDSLSLVEVDHTGISSIVSDPSLSVRPVPGSDQVLVYSDQAMDRLVVTDALGRIVHEARNVGTAYSMHLQSRGVVWVSCYTEQTRTTVGIALY